MRIPTGVLFGAEILVPTIAYQPPGHETIEPAYSGRSDLNSLVNVVCDQAPEESNAN
jgi:hypothetical protein